MRIPEGNYITEDTNFWELNPQYKYILADFYNGDRSKDKKKSSKIIWAIYFKVHPKSEYYRLPNKEEVINTRWLKNPKFNWSNISPTVEIFKDTVLTQAEKSLVAWDEMMKKRDEFIHGQDFTLDEYDERGKIVKGTADQLDKMLANTSKLYSEYFKIKKELADDEVKRGKGNKPESMSDSDEI